MAKKNQSQKSLRNAVLFISLSLCGMVMIGALLLFGKPDNVEAQTATRGLEPSATSFFVTATLPPPEVTETAPNQTPDTPTPTGTTAPPSPTVYPTLTALPLLVNPQTQQTIPVTWGQYPGPTIWPSTLIPPPMGVIPLPDEQINILLLGNDERGKLKGKRTDAIMLLTLNPHTGTASVTSFPRDLWVYAPGLTMMKLNSVYPRGGYATLFNTFEYNFGVRPDHYVHINRNAFVDLVDTLGGITVYVPYPLSDPDFAGGKFSVAAGDVHMDGRTARWYVSSRSTSNDFIRNQRQQSVLKAIFLKLISIDALHRGEELFKLYRRYVDTDLTLNELLPLLPLANQLRDTNRISRHAIGRDQVTADRTPVTRAYILVPDQLEVFKIMLQAVQP